MFALFLAIALVPFAFSRLPFFLYSRLPVPFPDTATYLWPLQDIEAGVWPAFDLRTPGYSLFWWLCRRVSRDIAFVVYAQSALSLGVAVFALVALRRHAPRLVAPAALALAVFLSGNAHLTWDLSLLSDGPFTAVMVAWGVWLFLTLKTGRARDAVMTSCATAAAIYLRPSSLYLIAILCAMAAHLWWHRHGLRVAVALLAPLGVALAALAAYNSATIGVAGLSAGGTWARLWSTTVYLDPDPRLAAAVNLGMAAKNVALAPADKTAIYEPGPMRPFRDALEKNIGAGIGQIAERVTGWPTRVGWRYMENRAMLDTVVSTAIAQHPRIFLKNMAGTTIDYFTAIALPQPDFYTTFPASTTYREAFVEPPFYVTNLAGYYQPRRPRGFHTTIADGRQQVTAPEHRLNRWYEGFSTVRSLIFENTIWIWTLPIALVLALRRLWQTGGASPEAAALTALLAAVAGNALACAFLGHLEYRYAAPFHFVNYLVAASAHRAITWNHVPLTRS